MSDRASARKWLDKARQDLDAAKRCMRPPCLAAIACFHAQQAAEKALKGVAVLLGATQVPRRHDLLEVAEIVKAQGAELPFSDEELASLNPYAVGARYPLADEPSEVAARAAIELVQRIVRWAQREIG